MGKRRLDGRAIFDALKNSINLDEQIYVVDRDRGDPFERLIAIILSQNTNDKNAKKALEILRRKIGIEPKALLRAGIEKIKDAIRVSGMYNQKSTRIYNLAKMVLEGFNLRQIIDLDTDNARSKLLEVPGLGPKTADVFLSIYGHKTIGVDTHISRIAKRLGLVDEKAGYEKIRRTLMDLFQGLDYDLVHRYMIAHGRIYCKAKNPNCKECPLLGFCSYGQTRIKQSPT